jgi:hypothetical protein
MITGTSVEKNNITDDEKGHTFILTVFLYIRAVIRWLLIRVTRVYPKKHIETRLQEVNKGTAHKGTQICRRGRHLTQAVLIRESAIRVSD